MIRALLTGLIRLYQMVLSPLLGPRCRFEPSCSNYALAVIQTHGPFRGGLLSLIRLCKCHPFYPGGYDPPPPPHPPLRTPSSAPPPPTSRCLRSRVGFGRRAANPAQQGLQDAGAGDPQHSNLPLIAEKAAAP